MTRRKGAWLVVAAAVAAAATASRRPTSAGYRPSLFWRAYDGVAQAVDRKVGWDRLPTPLGLLVLVGLRNLLRRHNLHDTTGLPAVGTPPVPPTDPRQRTARTNDGTHNDLARPSMGMAGSRFGRNVPIERTFPEPEPALLDPSPREVSRVLLGRPGGRIAPAEGANALVAAWLQFMIRDWFSHGKSVTENPWRIELADDDPWPQRPMRIMRTRPDPTRPPGTNGLAPTYANTQTHWWDGSQLYGRDREEQEWLRTHSDGKLRIDRDGLPPRPADPDRDPTRVPGYWLGLALMQHLFAKEHNAVCDRLRAEYPTWSDDELFERARLVYLTRDYTPEVYTPAGLDWIERTTMSTVLLRHYPQLRPALRSLPNAFMNWRRPADQRRTSAYTVGSSLPSTT